MGGRSSTKRVTAGHVSRKRGIGEQTFAEVEQLTANGAMKRTAAIAQVAQRIGSNPGTVAANYYRIARLRGVALRPGRSRASAISRGTGNARRKTSSKSIASAIRAIEAALRAQADELGTLRKNNARFQKLRRLLRS